MTDTEFDDFDDFDNFDSDDGDDQQAAVDRFEQEVSKKMKLLLTRKAGTEKRVEAALWLGEAGSPKAISTLRQVYKKDKDKKVKNASEYALGMFKALDNAILRDPGQPVAEALGEEENELVLEILSNIALKGEMGKRKRIKTSTLIRLMMFLTLSLIICGGINAFLMLSTDTSTGEDTFIIDQVGQSNTGVPALDVVNDLSVVSRALRFDATELQTQFTSLAPEGLPTNCIYTFNRPETYDADPSITMTSFTIESLVQGVNEQVDNLASVQTAFDDACGTTPEIPTSDEISTHLTALETLLTEVDGFDETIAQLQASLQPPTPTPAPAETEAIIDVTEEATEDTGPTATPTITPEPTIDPAIYFSAVREINRIINSVTEPRRALAQLEQAWEDVSSAGTTGACADPAPPIPEDYILPTDVAEEVPELVEATNQLNGIGLTLLRNGWDLFIRSCGNGTLSQNATTGLATAQTARAGFDAVRQILNDLQ